ncbi:asparagine synthase-related protein [Bradyrhizobium sp. SZCCHNR3016]|uniref:asparagine synthase-related protein n=1 Tax=Bradyrhizobium sp. SZCCHNR3016 TaxID=3057396 RepID=UPI0029161BD2|nr:asparagine synthase-related protein [Bradyrhizobium sp. SZCCHNR3016]
MHAKEESPDCTYVSRRGPDLHAKYEYDRFVFQHFLLHVTGELSPQPLVDGGIVAVFNGEIYNFPFARCDSENIIPAYRQAGVRFGSLLDGEFAIALYDFEIGRALFVTDPFGTKPLWVKGLSCASYQSCLGGQLVPPNTWVEVQFDGTICTGSVIEFQFNRQYRRSYDSWCESFERAVLKRYHPNSFIGLSSGYDSGAIACCLGKYNKEFRSYSIAGAEDATTLNLRVERASGALLEVSIDEYLSTRTFIANNAEPVRYSEFSDVPLHCDNMLDDSGAVGLGLLCARAVKDGRFVYVSGQGADEIISDYCLDPRLTTFGGRYPEALKPWPNFWGRCQRAYLCKEEAVGGAFGIETRYPFLDRDLVQEFLFLDSALKNRAYKAPILSYLYDHDYPVLRDFKVGFRAHAGLQNAPRGKSRTV